MNGSTWECFYQKVRGFRPLHPVATPQSGKRPFIFAATILPLLPEKVIDMITKYDEAPMTFRGEQASTGRRALGRASSCLALVSIYVALSGCNPFGPETVWSTTLISPDGKWVAGARTQMWSGPGVGTAGSSVYISRADDPRNLTVIVDYPLGAVDIHPQIKWRSAQELEVGVPNTETLTFQAVKFADIRITVKGISNIGDDPTAKAPAKN
jgi:hypothetical protein